MDSFWQGQTVLVTGASRGIGRSIAVAFAKLGCKVAINYNSSEEKAREVLAECRQAAGIAATDDRCRIYKADVGREAEVEKMMTAIESELSPVTILVNNAGITRDGLLMTMSTEDWRQVMSTHLDATFFCSRAALPNMLRNRRGRVINISSVSGIKGSPGQTNYSAAKAGMIGFTRSLAREMGKKNITSNAVALGVFETEMTQILDENVLKAYKDSTALKRFGKPEEVANLVTFLAGPQADYITGQVITIDGGMI